MLRAWVRGRVARWRHNREVRRLKAEMEGLRESMQATVEWAKACQHDLPRSLSEIREQLQRHRDELRERRPKSAWERLRDDDDGVEG
jgi:predicted  nucleic acid-binding Zn-ribbon protein